jgi:hypothetical protein
MAKKLETADADALARIGDAREKLREAESRHLIAKENAKAAKSSWEAAVEHLTTVIDSETRPLPLFDAAPAVSLPVVEIVSGTDQHGLEIGTSWPVVEIRAGGIVVQIDAGTVPLADGEYLAEPDVQTAIADARTAGVDGPEAWSEFWAGLQAGVAGAWRELPLSEAGITGKIADTLAGAGCETLGALVERMASGLGWNDGLKGIGEEKAAGLADKLADFWKDHPEFVQA